MVIVRREHDQISLEILRRRHNQFVRPTPFENGVTRYLPRANLFPDTEQPLLAHLVLFSKLAGSFCICFISGNGRSLINVEYCEF